jgi:hypothetical protein
MPHHEVMNVIKERGAPYLLAAQNTHKHLIPLHQCRLLLHQIPHCLRDFLSRLVVELLLWRAQDFGEDGHEIECEFANGGVLMLV